MAVEVREVDSNSVMAGGVTAANFPQLFKERTTVFAVGGEVGHQSPPPIVAEVKTGQNGHTAS